MRNTTKKFNKGFILLDALFAVLLIGMAVASLLVASQAVTSVNGAGLDLSTADFLSQQLREQFATLPPVDPQTGDAIFGAEEESLAFYDDLDDFDDAVFSPPIDISRAQLTDFSGYTQRVFVENVSTTNPSTVVGDHSTQLLRVRVEILKGGRVINSLSWLRSR